MMTKYKMFLLTCEAIARGAELYLYNDASGNLSVLGNLRLAELADIIGFIRSDFQGLSFHKKYYARTCNKVKPQQVETTHDKQEKQSTEDQTSVNAVVNPAELEV